MEGLGALGQFFWHARRAMEGTPVVDFTLLDEGGRGEWKGKMFICPEASRELFERLRPMVKRWRSQWVWAVDGSYKASDDPGVATMGRRAARHDGRTLSMALASAGDDSAYLAEFVAQLDVLAAEGCSRVMVLFDCTSPVEALNTFVRAHDRHKADYRRDELHSTWLQLLARFDVVVMIHVYSHRGAILNEWVDVLAKAALEEEQVGIPQAGPRQHVSIHFGKTVGHTTDGAAAGAWARGKGLEVMRAASRDSVWAEDEDRRPRRGRVSEEQEDVLAAVGCVRAFPCDGKRWPGLLGQRMREVRCVCGAEGEIGRAHV